MSSSVRNGRFLIRFEASPVGWSAPSGVGSENSRGSVGAASAAGTVFSIVKKVWSWLMVLLLSAQVSEIRLDRIRKTAISANEQKGPPCQGNLENDGPTKETG